LLAPAIGFSGGRISMSSVFDWLADRRYILWLMYKSSKTYNLDGQNVIRAAFVTRESHYPCRSMLTIDIAGGSDMAEWVEEADRVFRSYARAAGLDGIELYGRSGWTRALKNLGWTGGTVLLETSTAAGG
jgi:hypothetical protein